MLLSGTDGRSQKARGIFDIGIAAGEYHADALAARGQLARFSASRWRLSSAASTAQKTARATMPTSPRYSF